MHWLKSIFILLLIPYSSLGQQISSVDFHDVFEEIKDQSSVYYYPVLINRMVNKDTTLTQKDYYYLYYGNVFQEYYHPYGNSNEKKAFNDLFTDQDYKMAVEKGIYVLQENPVDLEVILKMSISYLKLDEPELKRYYAKQYYSFLEIIYQSGDGKTMETSYVVISVDHEYDLMADMGLRAVNQQLISDCDLLFISKRDQPKIKGKKKIKKLYFNVRMPLLSLSSTYKDADLPQPDDE
ncbi:MAG: DUF4919 domain-containing protein [Crocinitomicaceae bacterium]|nr:DUF4919 domain-containing protein [Crocinitomicaceae bacterium]